MQDQFSIATFIDNFIAAANSLSTDSFIDFWHPDAILNDPSIGRKFNGHQEIKEYFEDYFIGYQTNTTLIKSDILNDRKVLIEVLFTGNFPQKEIGGTFDFQFKEDKIIAAKADLI